tara:strand:+ start:8882 stop:10837 length:1956 start_codon:yes stop_codon:yes gene_type:complete
MANPFTKPKVDFDVYERENPAAEQLDWSKIAGDITKTVGDIYTARETQKAKDLTAFQKQQEELKTLNNKYSYQTLSQAVMKSATNLSEETALKWAEFTSGRLNRKDYDLWNHNIKTGFKDIKSYADSYEAKFKEAAERGLIDPVTGKPKSAELERYDVEMLAKLADLNNKEITADKDGNIVVLSLDEKGNPIPGESTTVQQLGGLLYQQTNNIDIDDVLKDIKGSLGEVSVQKFKKKYGYNILDKAQVSQAREEFIEFLSDEENEQAKKVLDAKVNQMVPDDKTAAILATSYMYTDKGKKYVSGSQDDYDKFARENPGEQNPVIVREFDASKKLMTSTLKEDQLIAVKDFAKNSILGALDVTETQTYQATSTGRSISDSERDNRRMTIDMGKNVFMLTTGNTSDAEAGARALAAANKNIERIQRIEEGGKVTGIRIIKKDGSQETVMYTDKDGKPRTAKQVQRSVYDYLVPKGKGYDYYLRNRGQVGNLSTATGGIDITNFITDEKVVGGGQFGDIIAQSITSEEKPLGKTIGDLRSRGTQNNDFVRTMTKILNNNSLVNADFLGDFEVTYKAKGDDGRNYNRVVIRYPDLLQYNIPIYDTDTLGEFIRKATNKIEEQNRKAVNMKNKGGQSNQDSQPKKGGGEGDAFFKS